MQPMLSQVCTLNASFEQDLADYAAGACRSVEVWFTKLENHLKSHSIEDVRQLCAEHDVTLPVASYQGGILFGAEDRRRESWNLFMQRLDLCQSLDIGTVVLACDVAGPLEQADLETVQQMLIQAASEAGKRRLRVALEFQASARFGNNLQTAAALVAEVGSPHLGLCLDAFHFFTGPSKTEDLDYLHAGNLFHVQLCDLEGVPREFAADADRILPGDGDLPLAGIVEHLRGIGYTGGVSVELLNPRIWQIPPRQFGEIAITAVRKLLGQASMRA